MPSVSAPQEPKQLGHVSSNIFTENARCAELSNAHHVMKTSLTSTTQLRGIVERVKGY
jgi:hypothetical protein